MNNVYYKVIEQRNREMYSFGHPSTNPNTCVYKLNEWISPKLSKSALFVFDNLYDAKRFASVAIDWNSKRTGTHIYTCSIEIHSYQPTKMIIVDSLDDSGLVTRMWNKQLTDQDKPLLTRVPTGTLFAKKVKLLEKIT